jgi:hypothetical protein
MKKQFLLLSCLFLLLTSIQAQITISASDAQGRLTVGKQITTFLDSTFKSINIGSKGNFGTVVFSGLKKIFQFVSTSQAVASTPYASSFPGATYATKNNQQFSGVDAINYVYISLGESYILYGIATESSMSGFSSVSKIKYNPAQVLYKLPMTYNSTNTQQISQEIETQMIGFPVPPTKLTNQYASTYTIDGYGKIKTPEGKTLDALRIKSVTTITSLTGTSTETSYSFLTRTGEAVAVSVKADQPDNGIVQITSISWNDGDGASGVEKINEMPSSFSLSQNYPNPFNPSTKISFALPKYSSVSLKVYDVIGKEVALLISDELAAGSYSIDFNASKLSSGIYFYELRAGYFTKTMKMLVIK